MKKMYILISIILLLFIGTNSIFAEEKKVTYNGEEYTFDDEHELAYCGHLKDAGIFGVNKGYKGCFIFDRNDFKRTPGEKTVTIDTGIRSTKLTERGTVAAKLVTLASDPVLNNEDKWWSSLLFCRSNSSKHATDAIYTDSLASNTEISSGLVDFARCATFSAVGIKEEQKLPICNSLNAIMFDLYAAGNGYIDTGDSKYATEYNNTKDKIQSLCDQVTKFADYNDECVKSCLQMPKLLADADETFNLGEKAACGFSGRLVAWVINILKWIKYIVPVFVIVLGILDFMKATGSDKDDEMKKAQGHFVKRLIAAALIFIVPLIIEFIFTKMGFDYVSCDMF